MVVKDEWFKHFRTFLKINGLYKEFMECFQRQQYHIIHFNLYKELRPNYIQIMKQYCIKNCAYEEFGAMALTFSSFKWVEGGVKFPIEFTKKWCTVGFKWGLYCLERQIKICSIRRFVQLIEYWERQHWINDSMITKKENEQYEMVKEEARQERIKSLNTK